MKKINLILEQEAVETIFVPCRRLQSDTSGKDNPSLVIREMNTDYVTGKEFQSLLKLLGYRGYQDLYIFTEVNGVCQSISVENKESLAGIKSAVFTAKLNNPKVKALGRGVQQVYLQDLVILGAMIQNLIASTDDKFVRGATGTIGFDPNAESPIPGIKKGSTDKPTAAEKGDEKSQNINPFPEKGATLNQMLGKGRVDTGTFEYPKVELPQSLRTVGEGLLKPFLEKGIYAKAFYKISQVTDPVTHAGAPAEDKSDLAKRTIEINSEKYYIPGMVQLAHKEGLKDESWLKIIQALRAVAMEFNNQPLKDPGHDEGNPNIVKGEEEGSKKIIITTGVQEKIGGMFVDGNFGDGSEDKDATGCIDKYSDLLPRFADNWASIIPAAKQLMIGTSAGVGVRWTGAVGIDALKALKRKLPVGGGASPRAPFFEPKSMVSWGKLGFAGAGIYGVYNMIKEYGYQAVRTGQAGDPSEQDAAGIQVVFDQMLTGLKDQADEKCFWMWFAIGALMSPTVFTKFVSPAFSKSVRTLGGVLAQSGKILTQWLRRNANSPKIIKMLEDEEYSELAMVLSMTDEYVLGGAQLARKTGETFGEPLSKTPIEIVVDVADDGYKLVFSAETKLGEILKAGGGRFAISLRSVLPGFQGVNIDTARIIPMIREGDYINAIQYGYKGTPESWEALRAIVLRKTPPGTPQAQIDQAMIIIDAGKAAKQLESFGGVLIDMGRKAALDDIFQAQARSLLHAVLSSRNASNILANTENIETLMKVADTEKLIHLFLNVSKSVDDLQVTNHSAILGLLNILKSSRKIDNVADIERSWGFGTGVNEALQHLEYMVRGSLPGRFTVKGLDEVARAEKEVLTGLRAFFDNVQSGEGLTLVEKFNKVERTSTGSIVKCLNPDDLRKLQNLLDNVKTPENLSELSEEVQELFELLNVLKKSLDNTAGGEKFLPPSMLSVKGFRKGAHPGENLANLSAYMNQHDALADALAMLLRVEFAATARGADLAKATGGSADLKEEVLRLYELTSPGAGRNITEITDIFALAPRLAPYLLKILQRTTPELSYLGAKLIGAAPYIGVAGYGFKQYWSPMFEDNKDRLQDYIDDIGTEGIEEILNDDLKRDYKEIVANLPDDVSEEFGRRLEQYYNSFVNKQADNNAKKELGSYILLHVLEPIYAKIKVQEQNEKENNYLLLKYMGTHALYHGLLDDDSGNNAEGVKQLGHTLRENFWKSIDVNLGINGGPKRINDHIDLIENFMFLYNKVIIVNIVKSRGLKMKKRIDEINRKMLKNIVIEVLKENSGLGYSSLSNYDRETTVEEENPEDVSREFDSFLQHYDRDKTNSAALELAKTLCSSEDGLEAFREMLELSKQLPELQKELVILMRNDEAS